ncbi:hypothetical protein E2C01_055142 [Portunus trituberculatus]|uniref:Uncharacterized protein n=1 Tax=Portunus trituberculatus TaxID=210409 RepID=A0A5B7GU13_PORTR|nr:hypothetical protein [Portunus trituberculatus]
MSCSVAEYFFMGAEVKAQVAQIRLSAWLAAHRISLAAGTAANALTAVTKVVNSPETQQMGAGYLMAHQPPLLEHH